MSIFTRPLPLFVCPSSLFPSPNIFLLCSPSPSPTKFNPSPIFFLPFLLLARGQVRPGLPVILLCHLSYITEIKMCIGGSNVRIYFCFASLCRRFGVWHFYEISLQIHWILSQREVYNSTRDKPKMFHDLHLDLTFVCHFVVHGMI